MATTATSSFFPNTKTLLSTANQRSAWHAGVVHPNAPEAAFKPRAEGPTVFRGGANVDSSSGDTEISSDQDQQREVLAAKVQDLGDTILSAQKEEEEDYEDEESSRMP